MFGASLNLESLRRALTHSSRSVVGVIYEVRHKQYQLIYQKSWKTCRRMKILFLEWQRTKNNYFDFNVLAVKISRYNQNNCPWKYSLLEVFSSNLNKLRTKINCNNKRNK